MDKGVDGKYGSRRSLDPTLLLTSAGAAAPVPDDKEFIQRDSPCLG